MSDKIIIIVEGNYTAEKLEKNTNEEILFKYFYTEEEEEYDPNEHTIILHPHYDKTLKGLLLPGQNRRS